MARSFALLVAAGILVAASAHAQSGAPLQTPVPGAGPITSPDEIRYCLCARQAVDALSARVAAETQHHREMQQRIDALDQELATTKSSVDVNQPDQVDAYRRLVETRERTMAEFYYQTTPQLQKLVADYNARSASYNASCTSRGMDAAAVEAAKASLVCPAP